jgi:hypothetical protein
MVYSRAGSGDGRFFSVGLVAPHNRNYRQFVEQLFDSMTDGSSVAYLSRLARRQFRNHH